MQQCLFIVYVIMTMRFLCVMLLRVTFLTSFFNILLKLIDSLLFGWKDTYVFSFVRTPSQDVGKESVFLLINFVI